MERFLRTGSFGLLLGVLCAVSPLATSARPAGCTSRDLIAALQPSNHEYADATELKQVLQAHGLVVGCVLRSKMAAMFEGQEGAALYRTDQGDFEALFLPKPKSWDALEIVQTEKNGQYWTSFTWPPKAGPTKFIDGAQRGYYVKHANVLCVAWSGGLSTKLNRILNLN